MLKAALLRATSALWVKFPSAAQGGQPLPLFSGTFPNSRNFPTSPLPASLGNRTTVPAIGLVPQSLCCVRSPLCRAGPRGNILGPSPGHHLLVFNALLPQSRLPALLQSSLQLLSPGAPGSGGALRVCDNCLPSTPHSRRQA